MRRARATGLLAIAFGLTAAVFDTEPLWVPAVTLALLAAGSAAWVALAARQVRVTRTLGARRVAEDAPLAIAIEVSAGALPLPPARLADPLLAAPVPLQIGPRGARVRIEASFGRRGRRVLAPPTVVVADPLGLAVREVPARRTRGDDEILVLPRIEPVVAARGGGEAAHALRRARIVAGAETDLDGIRALRAGTPASRIFWQALARGAEPQERVLASASQSSPLVVVDPREGASEEALDAAVRAAASLARALAATGGCSVLLPGDRRPVELGETLAGWARLHARLALLGDGAGPALAGVAQRSGPIVFVSARVRDRLPDAFGPGHGAPRVLVVPGALPSRHAAFAVAGCSGYVRGARPPAGARPAPAGAGAGGRS